MTDHVRMSIEDIERELALVARDGDGAAKVRALQLLSGMSGTTHTMPPPRSDREVIDRLVRVMKGSGYELTSRAYREAYPRKKDDPVRDMMLKPEHAPEHLIAEAKKIKSLRLFNKAFPEVRRPNGGWPTGYPAGQSIETQQEWLFRQALKILVERELQLPENTPTMDVAEDTDVHSVSPESGQPEL